MVRSGDSLRALAQSFYGDAKLWYVIAQANALGDDSNAEGALSAGLSLRIPDVSRASNNAGTLRVYQPSQVIGDTTPKGVDPGPPPPPSQDGGCGGVGLILMAVVAVVATVATQGAALTWFGGTTAGTLGTAASWAVGGAVGSIASQGVGLATGQIESFSWRAVGQAALGGAITGGVGAGLDKLEYLKVAGDYAWAASAARAAIGSGVNMALRGDWSWRDVMVSAVGAGVGNAVGRALSDTAMGSAMGGFGARLGGGLASGITATALTGGNRRGSEGVLAGAVGNA